MLSFAAALGFPFFFRALARLASGDLSVSISSTAAFGITVSSDQRLTMTNDAILSGKSNISTSAVSASSDGLLSTVEVEGNEKVLGAEHPSTLTSLDNLASVLQDQGKYGEAEKMNRRALEVHEALDRREKVTSSLKTRRRESRDEERSIS